ncbi:hypothetical protein [Rhodovibrio salinarum]|uniref:Uncharacterized protein n=1 Tax=Rhodovibrio salinarum TaxID=1087 RepID=A0A934UZA4_9PROT|nr:hypothetical protein [Rhodovibrio salinarum]MBK1696987.1 hypothetical protein [Rhodovibrio salinarum]
MRARPYVVYLDQNKWVDLARAVKSPSDHPAHHALLTALSRNVETGRLVLPLTAANIYETQKTNDPAQRHNLAILLATASQGLVFRGRHHRLEAELIDLLQAIHGNAPMPRAPGWFLSDVFFEAFADWNDGRLGTMISEDLVGLVHREPARTLYDYLMTMPNEVRTTAVQTFSRSSDDLCRRIEERRRQHAGESFAMRRRIHSALLMIDEIDLILTFANRAGFAWKTVSDIGDKVARRIVEDVPTYYVEREIALRLEAQSRCIEENDLRDMQSFCAAVPYADEVIAEKQFVNLARQAKLDRKYSTKLGTDILSLADSLEGLNAR